MIHPIKYAHLLKDVRTGGKHGKGFTVLTILPIKTINTIRTYTYFHLSITTQ
jgi:hypothetical protein